MDGVGDLVLVTAIERMKVRAIARAALLCGDFRTFWRCALTYVFGLRRIE